MEVFMNGLAQFVAVMNKILWDYLLLFLLVFTGVFFTLRLRFVQVRHFKTGLKTLFGGFSLNGGSHERGLSSFQALTTAIAAQVGTGNIAGAATAIASGGPGAIFWMWVSAFFGMLMCTVGLDPTNGIPRFITYSDTGLLEGFQFIPTLIGLFAVAEVIAGVERIINDEEKQERSNEKITNVLPDLKTIRQIWPNILSGGLIGTFIGAIPGAGGDIAVFVSYGFNKSVSKHPELWGTGIPNGVASTESANNGCSGGAMIPLLSLGVPGDSVTAILLGAFIMKGIQPGPMMYISELPTVYKVFAALMLANLAMLIVGCAGVRFFAKIVSVEKKMLYPIILVVSLLGAFSINKNVFDVGVCVVFGIIGWLMNKYEFPLSPILLALILGPMCEKNFVRFMNIQKGNFFAITSSPIAMVFLAVAIGTILFSIYNQNKINKREAAARADRS